MSEALENTVAFLLGIGILYFGLILLLSELQGMGSFKMASIATGIGLNFVLGTLFIIKANGVLE